MIERIIRMRIYRINKGKFTGEYEVFDSVKEFRESYPKEKLFDPWYSLEVVAGNWCVADDGYIIQCLHRYNLQNRYRQTTYCFRFCNGLYYAWNTKNGLKARRLDAALTKRHRNCLSETGPEAYRVNQFILFVNSGLDVYQAYKKAFMKDSVFIDRAHMMNRINLLLTRYEDRLVKGLRTFTQKLDSRIREKTGQEPEDVIAESIATMIVGKPTSNSRELRENIKLYMQLKNAFLKHNNKDSSEFIIDEERPPLLEENTDDSNS
jgi:hypothetical protein